MHQKLVPNPFLILVNNPKQQLHTQNSVQNKIIIKKVFKKLASFSFFLSNPGSFNGQNYQKQRK